MSLTICSPTYGRAGRVKTLGAFGKELILVCPEAQYDSYRTAYPKARIEPHPDTVKGIGAARQWIYDTFGDVFMADDDIAHMVDLTGNPVEKVEPEVACDVIRRTADMAKAMGAFMFGTSISPNPMHYKVQDPFRLTGSMNGMSMGLLRGSKIWFPKDTSVLEDTWAAGLNALYHRFVVVDNRYCLSGDHQTLGGVADKRTEASTLRDIEKAEAAFGDAFVRRNKDAVWAFDLRVPW